MAVIRSILDDMITDGALRAKSPCHPGSSLGVVHLQGELQISCHVCRQPVLEIVVASRPKPVVDEAAIVAPCHPACGVLVCYVRGTVRIDCFQCDAFVASFRVTEDLD